MAVALFSGLLVLVATRKGPLLSPDSITYLSAAQHLHAGRGLTDFTGRPLAVFGPLYPVLLSVGGRSLLWARLVGAAAATVATAPFALLPLVPDLADRNVYLCGPPSMLDAVRTALRHVGLPAEQLHEERFAW